MCKDCGGKSLCEHNREKYRCKDCGGKDFCEHGRRKSMCKDCKGITVTKRPPTSKRQVDGIPGTERLSKRRKKEAAVRASNDPQVRVRVCVCVVCVVAWIRFVTRTHTHTHTHTHMHMHTHTHTHKCTHIHGVLTCFPRTTGGA